MLLREAGLAMVLLGLVGCGGPQVVEKPIEAPGVQKKKEAVDYANLGRPEPLNWEIDAKGFTSIWLKDTKLLVDFRKTAWDEIAGTREGRATFDFKLGGEQKTLTVSEGDTKEVFGFTVTVILAHEAYLEDSGAYVPHVKFKIKRKK